MTPKHSGRPEPHAHRGHDSPLDETAHPDETTDPDETKDTASPAPDRAELEREGYEAPELRHVEFLPAEGKPTPWQRLAAASSWKSARSQLMAGLLCAILGFGVVVQVKQTDEDGLSSLSEPDLVRVLDDITERTNRLETEAESLEKNRDQLESGSDQQALAEQQAKQRADTLAILAGTAAATGPGVVLSLTDPKAQITAADMVNIVQELRDAGAEAIQVDDVRVVARTAFLPADGGGVRVGGQVLARPYTISAIGEAQTMSTAMRIPGGTEDVVRQRGGTMSITGKESLDVTAVVPDDGDKQ